MRAGYGLYGTIQYRAKLMNSRFISKQVSTVFGGYQGFPPISRRTHEVYSLVREVAVRGYKSVSTV